MPAHQEPEDKHDDALQRFAQAELETRWKNFVHKARVHEMLKCLRSEHQKLQVLKDNIAFDDIISPEDDKEEREHRRSQQDGFSSRRGSKGHVDVLFRRKAEDKDSKEELIPHMQKSPVPEDLTEEATLRTKKALKDALKSKTVITEEEFEEILDLCDDKAEQNALRAAYEEKKSKEKYLRNADEKRKMLYGFIRSDFFNRFLLVTIIVSTVGIFLMTFENISLRGAFPLYILDSCIIAIFVVEAILKITIYQGDYFKEPWNLLDLTIIIVHLMEVSVDLITKSLALSTDITDSVYFKFFKALRALRLIRIIKFLPNLQVVVATMFHSMLSMGSIAVLMVLFMFVFAVIGRGLFFEKLPKFFGSIWKAFLTLFQLLTLDDWFDLLQGIGQPEGENVWDYWTMFTYLFTYIIIEYFVFLNLFVAVLVDNFQITLTEAEAEKKKAAQLAVEHGHIYDALKLSFDESVDEEFWKTSLEQKGNSELPSGKYFPLPKGSKEAKLYSDIFKDFNSLDFERFLWKRRFNLTNMIMDQALSSQVNTWSIQDAETLSTKKVDLDGKGNKPPASEDGGNKN